METTVKEALFRLAIFSKDKISPDESASVAPKVRLIAVIMPGAKLTLPSQVTKLSIVVSGTILIVCSPASILSLKNGVKPTCSPSI